MERNKLNQMITALEIVKESIEYIKNNISKKELKDELMLGKDHLNNVMDNLRKELEQTNVKDKLHIVK